MNISPYPEDSLARLQNAEREILRVVDTLCSDNDIDYFIDGGTCLGAVRHGGFIPWDDDIDVGMPHDDYMRFCSIAQDRLPKGYSLHTSLNTEGFSALWAKVFKDGTHFIDDNAYEAGCDQGIFVDIFAYCKLDRDKRIAERQCKSARTAQVKSYLKHFSRPKLPKNLPAKPLVSLACKLVHSTVAKTWKTERLQYEYDHAFDTDNPGTTWVESAYTDWGEFDESVLFPTTDIEFDGMIVRAPHRTHEYLQILYGDYNRMPPEDERYTHAPVILDFGDGINVMNGKPSAG